MLVCLAKYLVKYYPGFNIFYYLKIRAIISLLIALFISLWIGSHTISYLQKISFNQTVRKNGPGSHLSKRDTPTMGGIIILIAVIISVLLCACLSNLYVWYVLIVLVSYGVIGFVDDYLKVVFKNANGMIAGCKYFWMSVIALTMALLMYLDTKGTQQTELMVPLFKDIVIHIKIFYIPLAYFVIIGTSNAVNLTDGLDGLAIIPVILVASSFALVAYATSNVNFANHLHMPYLPYTGELLIICNAIVGAGIGFLWFNAYPAQIFMGDIGSLSIGGALGVIAVILRQELLLIIIGNIFVIEALSVIFQVFFFKMYGRRIFLMAPIHHHYELKGWPEPRVTVRFWIISLVMMIIGLVTLEAY